MLILSRKLGERLVFRCGGEVFILHALGTSRGGMSLGFTAPAKVEIFREEVARRKKLAELIDLMLEDEEGTQLEVQGHRVVERISSYYAEDQLDE